MQTQQLIAGGRQPELRVPRDAGRAAPRSRSAAGSKPRSRDDLSEAYVFLRRLEHRLQMVADEQTHEIPDDPAPLASFARFCGYPDVDGFSHELTRRLETVETPLCRAFRGQPRADARRVNMVFAGEKDDPATVASLKEMGYARPEQVLETVRGWHHGRYAAVPPEVRFVVQIAVRERRQDAAQRLGRSSDVDHHTIGVERRGPGTSRPRRRSRRAAAARDRRSHP